MASQNYQRDHIALFPFHSEESENVTGLHPDYRSSNTGVAATTCRRERGRLIFIRGALARGSKTYPRREGDLVGSRRGWSRGCLYFVFSSANAFILSFRLPFLPSFLHLASHFELLGARRHPPGGTMESETKRQKRRTSQHRKRRNRGDKGAIRA